jgi:hypothetical protein
VKVSFLSMISGLLVLLLWWWPPPPEPPMMLPDSEREGTGLNTERGDSGGSGFTTEPEPPERPIGVGEESQ